MIPSRCTGSRTRAHHACCDSPGCSPPRSEQAYDQAPTTQWLSVAIVTSAVDVEIIDTAHPPSPHIDDDTLISEVAFKGR